MAAIRDRLRVESREQRYKVGIPVPQEVPNLRSTKHHPVQKNPQFLEGQFTRSFHAIFLNRRQDFIIPETSVCQRYILSHAFRGRVTKPYVALGYDHSLPWIYEYIDCKGRAWDLPSQVLLSLNFQCRDLQSHRLQK